MKGFGFGWDLMLGQTQRTGCRARLAVAKLPKNPYHPLQTLGAALYRAGKWEEAVQKVKLAIKFHGKGALPWTGSFWPWPTSASTTPPRPASG
jgi:hypothetical protein